MSDSLRNLFSHIKNAQARRALIVPYGNSKVVLTTLNVLQQNGYIRGYRFTEPRKLEISLKYKNQKPAINQIIIYEKKRRCSLSIDQLARRKSNELLQGTLILSTSKGIMSDITAHKLNVGGEVICKVS